MVVNQRCLLSFSETRTFRAVQELIRLTLQMGSRIIVGQTRLRSLPSARLVQGSSYWIILDLPATDRKGCSVAPVVNQLQQAPRRISL